MQVVYKLCVIFCLQVLLDTSVVAINF